ncbi:MAG: ribosomal protein S12 methylthiotransferase accessory factor [Phenylobacterium sp.]|jgi:ribosomal protein S12 methylthiotransferase accessory factor
MNTMNSNTLPAHLLSVLDRLVDENTGIITQWMEVSLQQCEYGLFIYAAESADVNYAKELQYGTTKSNILSSGSSFSQEEAIWAVVGEACERYTAHLYSMEHTLYASQDELTETAVPLADFVTFSAEQYACDDFLYHAPNGEQAIHWVAGQSLTDGRKVHVPAQLVWLGFPCKTTEEIMFPQVSTGLAAGADHHHAISGGLREVIERDAFSCHWLLKHTPKRVKLADVLSVNPQLAKLVERTNLDINLLWMTTDIDVPCIMCILQPINLSGVAIGMACHLDPFLAAEKAILEAYNTFNWILEMKRRRLSPVQRNDVCDFEDHVRYYLKNENRETMDFLLKGDYLDSQTLSSYRFEDHNHKTHIAEILRRVNQLDYSAYVVDITQPDFEQLSIFTVKVLIPGLQPLHVGIGTESHDNKRLKIIADKWSIQYPEMLNPEPHPFP